MKILFQLQYRFHEPQTPEEEWFGAGSRNDVFAISKLARWRMGLGDHRYWRVVKKTWHPVERRWVVERIIWENDAERERPKDTGTLFEAASNEVPRKMP